MQLELTTEKVKADIEVILVNKKIKENKTILENLGFKGEDEQTALLAESKKLYIGCSELDSESIKIAYSNAIKTLRPTKFKKIAINAKENLKEIVEGLILGDYSFDVYKSEKPKEVEKEVFLVTDKIKQEDMLDFEEVNAVCNAVNMARDIVNTPPEDFYPETMAKKAKEIAKENNLGCKIYDERYLQKNNMGAMLAVARASRHKPRLIHLSHKPKSAKKKIVLVGKGLTYDSGGLSLKPSDFMVGMKMDKAGGVAVLAIMDAVAKLNLPIEVHGIVGAVENMIGGDAYKPDDVLYARNGKTIEVKNTDAEGRLVLADCLCYVQEEIKDIDCIMDFATLTGACVVGVGEYTNGIMGNNTTLNNKIVKSALKSGEEAAVLPFNRYLKKLIKSDVADICNIASSRYGGAITAGLFLEAFIEKKYKQKWSHIDIAGPAFANAPWAYNAKGGTGAGVRMTVEFIKSQI